MVLPNFAAEKKCLHLIFVVESRIKYQPIPAMPMTPLRLSPTRCVHWKDLTLKGINMTPRIAQNSQVILLSMVSSWIADARLEGHAWN